LPVTQEIAGSIPVETVLLIQKGRHFFYAFLILRLYFYKYIDVIMSKTMCVLQIGDVAIYF
ncbi:hypothetical protein D9V10_03040, partial [Staphylococcus hominis]